MNRSLIALATFGSVAMLLGAFGFQYIGELAPCKLCIWQRWPHAAAIAFGLLALTMGQRLWAILGASAALLTATFGIYHTGVERKWWEGPNSCTSGDITNLSTDQLMQQILTAPLIRCDEVPWEMFTLSMATWNALISFGIFLIWISALRRG